MGSARTPYRISYRHELTPRQQEVLALLAQGRTNAQIGDSLGIGYETVKTHVADILGKLGVDTREGAAALYKEQRATGYRVRHAARGIAAVATMRAAALIVGAVLVIAAVTAAILLQAGGDVGTPSSTVRSTPTSTATATSAPGGTATAEPTTVPTPVTPQAIPETVGGRPVVELVEGDPVEFPDDVVLYLGVSECANCGFGLGGLRRIYKNDAGELVAHRPLPPGAEVTGYISSFWQSEDGYEIYAALCVNGCGGEDFPAEDGVVTVWQSTDGGITWTQVDAPPFDRTSVQLEGKYEGELLVETIAYLPSNQVASADVLLLPSMTKIERPVNLQVSSDSGYPRSHPALMPDGELLWVIYDSPRNHYYDLAGTPVPVAPVLDTILPGASWSDAGHADGIWWGRYSYPDRTDPGLFVQIKDGEPVRGFKPPPEYLSYSLRLRTELSEDRWIGSAIVALAPGEQEIGGNDNFRAVLVDIEAGTIRPILGLPRDDSPLDGNFSWPYTAVMGDFVRVSGGECVDIRREPAATAASIGCFHEGVLLRQRPGPDVAGWLAVATPAGEAGFLALSDAAP